MDNKTVKLGMLGSGFASRLHLNGIKKVHGYDCEYTAFTTMEPNESNVRKFQKEFGISTRYDSLKEMLADQSIHAISICTPTSTHPKQIIEIMNAGKDAICEKPLLGYCGDDPGNKTLGRDVSKKEMYETVLGQLETMEDVVKKSGKHFMYAENWIYSPSVLKADSLLKNSDSRILTLRGDAKLGGSHTPDACQWARTGGGVLMRIGCHAISALCFLKMRECERRGAIFGVRAVSCTTANIADLMSADERRYINAQPVDVEDWAEMVIDFSDGTKGVISTSDVVLGGLRFGVGVEASNLQLYCNLSSANQLSGFVPDKKVLNGAFVKEKVETTEGFQDFCIEEEGTRGYLGEMQDFVECISLGRDPLSNFRIASNTIKIVYAGYVSAEEGRTVCL